MSFSLATFIHLPVRAEKSTSKMVSTTRVLSLMAATAVQSVAISGRGLSSECAADAVALGTAADFAIIGKSGISNVARTVITGNIGVSPIAG
jgi:hypothetical protein